MNSDWETARHFNMRQANKIRLNILFITTLLLFCAVGKSNASLIHNIKTDTPHQLDVTWEWSGTSSSSTIELSYWDVFIDLTIGPGSFSYHIKSTHLVDPDYSGQNMVPNTFEMLGGIGFHIIGQPNTKPPPYGLLIDKEFDSPLHKFIINVEPTMIPELFIYTYGTDNSMDKYHFAVYNSEDPSENFVHLIATHVSPVPVPGAFFLLVTGLLGFIGINWKNRYREM